MVNQFAPKLKGFNIQLQQHFLIEIQFWSPVANSANENSPQSQIFDFGLFQFFLPFLALLVFFGKKNEENDQNPNR